MANPIVLVTDHCYLQCQSVNSIIINEPDGSDDDGRLFILRKRKKKSAKKKVTPKQKYQICIDFVPVAVSNVNGSGRNDFSVTVTVSIMGHEACLKLFGELCHQIREQLPDHLFLNQLVDRFLAEDNKSAD